MKWLIAALLMATSLFAQQGAVLPAENRVDASKFSYTDYPMKRNTWNLAEAKGKVVVVAFLAEGYKAAAQSLKELHGLQKQEGSQDLLVVPVYDVHSRGVIDTTIGASGQDRRVMTRVGVSARRADEVLVGDGMFKYMPLSFKIFQEFVPNHHVEVFPKFQGQPAIFIVDRMGRIAYTMWGYQKGQLTKVAQSLLDEAK